MTTLATTIPTLADVTRLTGPDGKTLPVGELLEQTTPIAKEAAWVEGNMPSGNRTAIRTGLPTVSLRSLNEGVASSKSTFANRDEACAIIETWSTIDDKVLQMATDKAATRFAYSAGDIEAMGQKAEELAWYGNEDDDEREYTGFTFRADYSALGDQALSAGGTSNCSSIWLVGWSPNKVAMMYPKGSRAGLQTKDWGLAPVQTSTTLGGTTLAAWRMQYTWDIGLTIMDPRYVVRIANILNGDVLNPGNSGTQELTDYTTNIIFLMARALHRIPNLAACRPVFYMPRTVMEGFDVQHLARTAGNAIQTREVQGEWMTTFRGVPCRISDQLTYTEARIT